MDGIARPFWSQKDASVRAEHVFCLRFRVPMKGLEVLPIT